MAIVSRLENFISKLSRYAFSSGHRSWKLLSGIILKGFFLVVFFPITATSTQKSGLVVKTNDILSDRHRINLQADCTLHKSVVYRQISLPMRVIPFAFDPVNGVERKTLLFVVLCGEVPPASEYLQKTIGSLQNQDGEFDVYNIGVANQLHVKRDGSIYYFCDPYSARRDDHNGISLRGCEVETPIDPIYKLGSGRTLVAMYGIDYQNRRHIPEINNVIQSFVQAGIEAK